MRRERGSAEAATGREEHREADTWERATGSHVARAQGRSKSVCADGRRVPQLRSCPGDSYSGHGHPGSTDASSV